VAGLVFLCLVNIASFRGVWIPRWSLSRGFDVILSDLAAGQFNHCFVQIFALGETYYPSRLAPNKQLFSAGRLKEFIHQAHTRNIKVHAWFNLFYIASYNAPSPDPLHPINRRPDWFVWEQGGRPILSFLQYEIERAGLEGYYVAPANYWVKEHFKSIILEAIKEYDFDGVHLDYVRYPSKDFAYDPATRTSFARMTYVDPEDLYSNRDALTARVGLSGAVDLGERWFHFLCDDLSTFVYSLNIEIKRQKPGIYLSAAVKPNPVQARAEYYQDWATWINRGYIDFVCLMAYTKNLKSILTHVEQNVMYQDRVMAGLGLYIQSPGELEQQVKLLNAYDLGGIVFFSYEDIRKNRAFLSVGR